jgi:hypothetical protein
MRTLTLRTSTYYDDLQLKYAIMQAKCSMALGPTSQLLAQRTNIIKWRNRFNTKPVKIESSESNFIKDCFQATYALIHNTVFYLDSATQEIIRELYTPPLLISKLGWTPKEAFETRARLAAFEEDWDAPGMECYDNL